MGIGRLDWALWFHKHVTLSISSKKLCLGGSLAALNLVLLVIAPQLLARRGVVILKTTCTEAIKILQIGHGFFWFAGYVEDEDKF